MQRKKTLNGLIICQKDAKKIKTINNGKGETAVKNYSAVDFEIDFNKNHNQNHDFFFGFSKGQNTEWPYNLPERCKEDKNNQ